jgi:hypothetical protein
MTRAVSRRTVDDARVKSVALAIMLASCAAPLRPPAPELLTKWPRVGACDGGKGNEVRLSPKPGAEAPVLVLQEIKLHGWQPPQPSFAVWEDGEIDFLPDADPDRSPETWRRASGRMSREAARAFVRRVGTLLATAPAFTQTWTGSGGQVTSIAVRDGTRWRVVIVDGNFKDDFIRVANGVPLPKGGWFEKAPPPVEVARAYDLIMKRRPASRGPEREQPGALITLFEPDVTQRPTMDWPASLPPPSPALQPSECNSYTTEGCKHYTLDPALARAARTLVGHEVIVHGKRFVARIDDIYAGELDIQRVFACANKLFIR